VRFNSLLKLSSLNVFGVEKEGFNANPPKSGGLCLKKIAGSGNQDRDGMSRGLRLG